MSNVWNIIELWEMDEQNGHNKNDLGIFTWHTNVKNYMATNDVGHVRAFQSGHWSKWNRLMNDHICLWSCIVHKTIWVCVRVCVYALGSCKKKRDFLRGWCRDEWSGLYPLVNKRQLIFNAFLFQLRGPFSMKPPVSMMEIFDTIFSSVEWLSVYRLATVAYRLTQQRNEENEERKWITKAIWKIITEIIWKYERRM